jgi:hypothetical protein
MGISSFFFVIDPKSTLVKGLVRLPITLVISLNAVPKLTVFEFSSSVSDIYDWNHLLELLGTVGNSMSEVFSRLQGRSKFNSRKLLCQIHLYLWGFCELQTGVGPRWRPPIDTRYASFCRVAEPRPSGLSRSRHFLWRRSTWNTPSPIADSDDIGAWDVLFCPKRQDALQKWRCILGTEPPSNVLSAKASPTTKNTRRFSPERERQVSVKGAVSAWAVAHIRVVDNKCTCSKQPKAE